MSSDCAFDGLTHEQSERLLLCTTIFMEATDGVSRPPWFRFRARKSARNRAMLAGFTAILDHLTLEAARERDEWN